MHNVRMPERRLPPPSRRFAAALSMISLPPISAGIGVDAVR